jgi:hypothetical protein
MKTSRSTTNQQSKQGISKKPKPEIRDDLDSRERKSSSLKTNTPKNPKRK